MRYCEPIAKICGPIRQLAFVPADIEAALAFWIEIMGVGPFYRLGHIVFDEVVYRGQRIAYDSSAYLAFWGDIEIELLCQHDHTPSMLTEWRRQNREGLHHVRVQVPDLGATRATFIKRGGEEVQAATLPGGSAYSMIALPGLTAMIEVSYLDPRYDALFALMKQSTVGWDGGNPIRAIETLAA